MFGLHLMQNDIKMLKLLKFHEGMCIIWFHCSKIKHIKHIKNIKNWKSIKEELLTKHRVYIISVLWSISKKEKVDKSLNIYKNIKKIQESSNSMQY